MTTRHVFIYVIFAYVGILGNISAATYFLKVLTNPSGCFGGQVCQIQPSVSVVDSKGAIVVNYVGSAYIYMSASPSGFEKLYVGQSCDVASNCGVVVSRSNTLKNFVLGVVTFQVFIYIQIR